MNKQTVPDDVMIDIKPLKKIELVQIIRHAENLDKAVELMDGLANNGWLTLFGERQREAVAQHEVGEAVPKRVQDIIRFCMSQYQDFEDKDWRDHGFKISTYEKALAWLSKSFTTPPLPQDARELLEKAKDFLLYLNQSGVLTGEDKLRKHLVALMEENYHAIEAYLIPTEKEPS